MAWSARARGVLLYAQSAFRYITAFADNADFPSARKPDNTSRLLRPAALVGALTLAVKAATRSKALPDWQ